MTIEEIVRLTRKSRRSVMRMVQQHELPTPIEFFPMSWDEQAVMRAWKKIKAGEKHGSKTKPHRNGRSKRARTARMARARAATGTEA